MVFKAIENKAELWADLILNGIYFCEEQLPFLEWQYPFIKERLNLVFECPEKVTSDLGFRFIQLR